MRETHEKLLAILLIALSFSFGTPAGAKPPSQQFSVAQQLWAEASDQERKTIAERIGEEGGEQIAKQKGWKPILTQQDKTWRLGPDQVYRDQKGTIHVIEAKGGSSKPKKAYGYSQGTPEWAVESAKRGLKSPSSSPAEKRAYAEVTRAAREGKLVVHVVQTPHVRGKAGVPRILSSTPVTKGARRLAKAFRIPKTSMDPTRRPQNLAGNPKRLPFFSKSAKLGQRFGALAKVADVATYVVDTIEIEIDYEAKRITKDERTILHVKSAGKRVGGWTGAELGSKIGAQLGTNVGARFGPVGAGIGGAVGCLAGGIGGYYAGEAAVQEVVDYADELIVESLTAVREGAEKAFQGAKNGVQWTGSHTVKAGSAIMDAGVAAAEGATSAAVWIGDQASAAGSAVAGTASNVWSWACDW